MRIMRTAWLVIVGCLTGLGPPAQRGGRHAAGRRASAHFGGFGLAPQRGFGSKMMRSGTQTDAAAARHPVA